MGQCFDPRIFNSALVPGAATSFTIIQADSGTAPVADSDSDTLTLTSANSLLTTSGNSTTDTITFTIVEANFTLSNMGGTLAINHGGTGQTTAAAAFNALSPLTTLGDTLYASGVNTAARLAGNITTTKKFLRQTGDGANSAAPAWDTIAVGDVPTLNQNTTGTALNITASSNTSLTSLANLATVGTITSGTWSGTAVAVAKGGTGSTTAAAAAVALTPASVTPAALAIDWAAGQVFAKSISGNSVFTFSNAVDGQTIVLALTTTGSFTATFPTAKWPGGSQPVQTASGVDVYTFVKIGSTIYASVVQAMA